MQVLSHLWSSGISAALLPREAPSLTEQYEYAHDLGETQGKQTAVNKDHFAWQLLGHTIFCKCPAVLWATLACVAVSTDMGDGSEHLERQAVRQLYRDEMRTDLLL